MSTISLSFNVLTEETFLDASFFFKAILSSINRYEIPIGSKIFSKTTPIESRQG